MDSVLLKTSELFVVVVNNEAGAGDFASHRPGYNGIWSLTSAHAPENCFVPFYAGLNLEHCMDDLFMTDEGVDNFEPRHAPMELRRLSKTSASLHQSPTPLTGVESETVFEVLEPHTIDMRFTARLHRPPRAGRWFGFFWASYINAPHSPALHFLDADGMLNAMAPDVHGEGGANAVCHASVEDPALGDPGRTYAGHSLAHSWSRRRFSLPLMFGRPGDGSILFLQMFDQTAPVRIAMSPSGGGRNDEEKRFNPAWDFQYVVNEAGEGTECHLCSRVIYKRYEGLEEIERLYGEWTRHIAG
ncbi:MAG TPA: hypothetical protein PLE60_01780 [Candidatus Latescibacteria bacterium]|nr:hypothetical protein [Candidatus Latescibacterota bacterium]